MDFRLSAEQSLKLGAVIYDNDFFANARCRTSSPIPTRPKYAYKPIDNPLIDFS